MTTDTPENSSPSEPLAPAAPEPAATPVPTTKGKNTSLYIVLGIVTVIGLFVISAVINTWSSVQNMGVNWKPGKVFSSASSGSSPIVILDVDGVIFNSRDLLESIAKIEKDRSIKGVVIRINSPGGAVAPTQEIVQAIERLKKGRKVYCSFANIAASGGYYIATTCSQIFTNPGTLTGSIGVIMPFANLQELYKFAKIEPSVIKAGRFKDIGSESRPMTADERILLQNMADEIHRQFKEAVKKGRSLGDDVIQEYADGRIFLGSQAIDYGFADKIGGEHETLEALAKELKIKVPKEVVRFPEPEPKYPSIFHLLSSKLKPEAKHSEASEIVNWIAAKVPELNPQLTNGVPYFLPYGWFTQK